jgi:dihydroorotase
VAATDHAPHAIDEKRNTYFKAPSGGPLVQHSLTAMFEFFHNRRITVEQIVEKMCHNPAILFGIRKRGFIRTGYWADLALVDANCPWRVERNNILSKCRWSPFEGQTFGSKVTRVWVNGNPVYDNGRFDESFRGMALEFDR